MPFTRRKFLKATGLGLAAAGVGLGGLVAYIQPRRNVWVPEGNDKRPERPSSKRNVVVAGGGLAGLSAATELQARGFQVTLIERAAALGGRLGGWPIQALGRRFPMEHGYHGFFNQYYNLKDLLVAAGATKDLVLTDKYPLLYRTQPEESFGTTTSLFPFNLGAVILRSPSMHLADFRDDGPGLEWMMKYDPVDTFKRFDNLSFLDFMKQEGIHGGMVDTILKPFAKPMFQRLEALSAAEAIRFFHFYFMGNPDGLGFQSVKRDIMTAVLDPLRSRYEQLGGFVKTGTSARRLLLDESGKKIAGLVVDAGLSPLPQTKLAMNDVPPESEGWREVATDAARFFVGRRGGEVVAVDGRCMHMGCPVRWIKEASEFQCPCHGGRYDVAGTPTGGPPKAPLQKLPVVRDGEVLAVGGAVARGDEVIPCDYVVVACDVPGLKEIVGSSGLERAPDSARFVANVRKSGVADPYSVCRFWLDKPSNADRAPFYTVSGYPLTDSVAFYSQYQEPYIQWARENHGSVVECHAYGIATELQGSVESYRDRFLAELPDIIPELRGARVLHEELMAQENFTRWAPGDAAIRPSTKTPIPNLFLAGDHVALPLPVFLMEGAVVSGRFAANAILAAEGVREIPIPYVAAKGPLA